MLWDVIWHGLNYYLLQLLLLLVCALSFEEKESDQMKLLNQVYHLKDLGAKYQPLSCFLDISYSGLIKIKVK